MNAACRTFELFEDRCANCTAPADSTGTMHARGRWRDGPRAVVPDGWTGRRNVDAARGAVAAIKALATRELELERGRAIAARIRATDFDGDVCECGRPLKGHPPLPKVKPLGGWESRFTLGQPWRNTISSKPGYMSEKRVAYLDRRRRERTALIP